MAEASESVPDTDKSLWRKHEHQRWQEYAYEAQMDRIKQLIGDEDALALISRILRKLVKLKRPNFWELADTLRQDDLYELLMLDLPKDESVELWMDVTLLQRNHKRVVDMITTLERARERVTLERVKDIVMVSVERKKIFRLRNWKRTKGRTFLHLYSGKCRICGTPLPKRFYNPKWEPLYTLEYCCSCCPGRTVPGGCPCNDSNWRRAKGPKVEDKYAEVFFNL